MGLAESMMKNVSRYEKKDAQKAKSKASKGKPRKPEAILQDAIIKHFLADGFMVVDHNSGTIRTESGGFFHAYTLSNTGGNGGLSDVTVGLDGKLVYLEVKTGYNKQTPAQIRFQELCKKFRMPYEVAYSVEEADRKVKQHFNYN